MIAVNSRAYAYFLDAQKAITLLDKYPKAKGPSESCRLHNLPNGKIGY
jgi:hypothetical protein